MALAGEIIERIQQKRDGLWWIGLHEPLLDLEAMRVALGLGRAPALLIVHRSNCDGRVLVQPARAADFKFLLPPMADVGWDRVMLASDPSGTVTATVLADDHDVAHDGLPFDDDGLPVLRPGTDQAADQAIAALQKWIREAQKQIRVAETITWQDAQERLDRIRLAGKPWKGYKRMAEAMGAKSIGPLRRAIRKGTVELQEWAKKKTGRQSRLTAPPEVAEVEFAIRTQTREPNPADVLPPDDLDVTLTKLKSQIPPHDWEQIAAKSPAEQRAIAEIWSRDYDTDEQDRRHQQAKTLKPN